MHDTRGDNLGASRKHRGERERRGIHPEDGARKRWKDAHVGAHWSLVRSTSTDDALSGVGTSSGEKLSLIVAVVRGLELAHSPRDRGLGARGARGGTGGVSQSRPICPPSST